MNPIHAICNHESCRASNKCNKRRKMRSLKLDVEYPSQDFGAVGTTHKQVQHAATIGPTTAVVNKDCKNADQKSNKIKKPKITKKQLEQDLQELRNDNAKLNEKIITLGRSKDMLTEVLRQEKKINALSIEEFNRTLLENDDYQCCICRLVFIRPVLVNCSHMFCEWCIDKWLEKYNYCPICRVVVVRYTHCLNMNNFIERNMQQKEAEVRYAYKKKAEARALDKKKSLEIQAERKQFEIMTMALNQQPSN